MHNFVYLAQRRSHEFSSEPNFGGGGRAARPWLRHCFLVTEGYDTHQRPCQKAALSKTFDRTPTGEL